MASARPSRLPCGPLRAVSRPVGTAVSDVDVRATGGTAETGGKMGYYSGMVGSWRSRASGAFSAPCVILPAAPSARRGAVRPAGPHLRAARMLQSRDSGLEAGGRFSRAKGTSR